MNRRDCLKAIGIAPAAMSLQAGEAGRPIQLHLDLEVDPAREKEMLASFLNSYRPAIRMQPGFVDVQLLKLQIALVGKAPARCPYRLLIGFQSEAQRKTWVSSPTNQKVWPLIENTLRGAKYVALLYDAV